MATNKMTSKFDWGQSVQIIDSAPNRFRTFQGGSVCGIHMVDTEEGARLLGGQIGTYVYTVENEDGMDMEVPEAFLKPA